MSDWDEIVNPTIRQVYECFKEVTECILDEGCRFKIKRRYGLHGYMCFADKTSGFLIYSEWIQPKLKRAMRI